MAQDEVVVVGIDVAKDKVDACIRSLSQRQTFPSTAEGRRALIRWLRKHLEARPEIADEVLGIVGRLLRKEKPLGLDRPPIREDLRRCHGRDTRSQGRDDGGDGCATSDTRHAGTRYGRRIACSVKSSSFIGTLYCSLSSVIRVRLPRLRSAISMRRAVQMPCTLATSE